MGIRTEWMEELKMTEGPVCKIANATKDNTTTEHLNGFWSSQQKLLWANYFCYLHEPAAIKY
jgi:hypothetical protein